MLAIRQKIHSRYDIKLWKDPWIFKRPPRLARPSDPVVYLRMAVIDLIKGELKEWDVEMFENLVVQEDIPLIRSLAINRITH